MVFVCMCVRTIIIWQFVIERNTSTVKMAHVSMLLTRRNFLYVVTLFAVGTSDVMMLLVFDHV